MLIFKRNLRNESDFVFLWISMTLKKFKPNSHRWQFDYLRLKFWNSFLWCTWILEFSYDFLWCTNIQTEQKKKNTKHNDLIKSDLFSCIFDVCVYIYFVSKVRLHKDASVKYCKLIVLFCYEFNHTIYIELVFGLFFFQLDPFYSVIQTKNV